MTTTAQNHTNADLSATISSGRTMGWKMLSIKDEAFAALRKEFSCILDEIDRADLKIKLDFCLREFCANSQKAMIKRLFFKENNSDIHNPDDYERLIPEFRNAWVDRLDEWECKLHENGLFYQVNVQCKDGFFNLFVANPGKVLPVEQERIRKQIALVSAPPPDLDADEDPFAEIGLGSAEGGGLGILLVGRMLESLGCRPNSLSFWVYEDKIVFMLRIPLNKQAQNITHVHQALAKEIENLPSFPENLIQIQNEIDQPDVMMPKLAEMIQRDPGLAALVLKTANSAAFIRLQKVTELSNAIAYIGLKGLKALLLYQGVEKQFAKNYSKFHEVMDHSYSVASIAGKIAKKFLPKQKELAYVGGLLHDMGKIIILEHPTAFKKIVDEFRQADKISSWCFENLSFGLDHAELGAQVAKRWNFPPELESIIHYHHDLSSCPESDLPLTAIVYFADAAVQIANGDYPAYLLHSKVLEQFNLKSDDEVIAFANSLL